MARRARTARREKRRCISQWLADASLRAAGVSQVADLRVIVRKTLRYGVVRGAVGLAAVLPFVWIGAQLFEARDQSLAAILSGRDSISFAAALLAGIAGLRLRRPVIALVDRVFFREHYDSREILLELAEATRGADTAADLARLLSVEIDRALHLDSIAVWITDPSRDRLFAPDHAQRPLDAATELARFLATRAEPTHVDLEQPDSVLRSLPESDRQWLADTGAALIVPLLSDLGELIGLLALGGKRSELPFSREDQRLLAVIGAAVATALENRILRASTGGIAQWRADLDAADAWDRSVAKECVRCFALHPPDAGECQTCHGALDPVAIPYRVLGKFQLESRIGAGGMGMVYRGVDLALQRPVALKTLPRVSPEDSMRLRREARAMAAISHPNLAMIYGAETWRGVPILILELLEGGTLAERIAKQPLAPGEAMRLGAVLADVLACTHAAGILHRDIKPSNVAYTRDGVPKLLDFGLALARAPEIHAVAPWPPPGGDGIDLRTVGMVGTPLYMSPEALRRAPAEPAFDLWSLAVVLYEAIAGRHPFERASWTDTLDAIVRADPPDVRTQAPACPEAVARLLADCLAAQPRRRPADVRELRARVAKLASELGS